MGSLVPGVRSQKIDRRTLARSSMTPDRCADAVPQTNPQRNDDDHGRGGHGIALATSVCGWRCETAKECRRGGSAECARRGQTGEATGGARPLRFGVVAPITTDLPAWRDQVRRIADSGYSTLLMPDAQQWQPAPGPTLAVAATLADLRVGTWVYASPLRTPWSMAWEAHSLSVLY